MIGPVRIVIGEDQALLRHSLVRLLEDAEAVGYLLKDRVADLAVFDEAVRRVGAGGTVLDLAVVTRMLGRARRADPVERLSEREREVLALMAARRHPGAGVADDRAGSWRRPCWWRWPPAPASWRSPSWACRGVWTGSISWCPGRCSRRWRVAPPRSGSQPAR
jgi:hypothetical protein